MLIFEVTTHREAIFERRRLGAGRCRNWRGKTSSHGHAEAGAGAQPLRKVKS